MVLDTRKYSLGEKELWRDIRPWSVRVADYIIQPGPSAMILATLGLTPFLYPPAGWFADLLFLFGLFFFLWLYTRDRSLKWKLPASSHYKDNNSRHKKKKGEGIMFMGNDDATKEQIWFSNSDARTHILYLGTTGAGKTEGLKSIITNALCWSSGFVYVDGKADTDLWSSVSSLVKRFGRDDDLMVLNFMTGNSDARAPSNSMNPFSSGSASYLTNMLVSLMPDAEGDNAMWKERAVALIGSLLPALVWKRDNQELPLSVTTIRQYLNFGDVIKLSRDATVPDELKVGIKGYLDTLPGYNDDAFDDEGRDKAMGPDMPPVDSNTIKQQHGYLSMQFTRALQSLGDDYGYIFDTQAADIDMADIVLNRRLLIALIPALEKSSDEIANLGKIIAATLKGMMGSTLGSTVEGTSAKAIENKPTHSATPFITVFDEVGYYTAQGMAVMAAQARSLGFCLVYAAQDLPALQKRVKEEARSITANCNIKIFGKLEDPTETKEFFEKTVGSDLVSEVSSFQATAGSFSGGYHDTLSVGVQERSKSDYSELREFKEGQAVVCFAAKLAAVNIFYSNPGMAKAMRVQRLIYFAPPDEHLLNHAKDIAALRDKLTKKTWTAESAEPPLNVPEELAAAAEGFVMAKQDGQSLIMAGSLAIAHVHGHTITEPELTDMRTPPKEESPTKADDKTKKEEAHPKTGGPMGFFLGDSNDEEAVAEAEAGGFSWARRSDDEAPPPPPVEEDVGSDVDEILSEAADKIREGLGEDISDQAKETNDKSSDTDKAE